MGRVGVFGGTFDPIHFGHLAIAQEAAERLGLAVVYFVPAGRPPHKRDRPVSPPEERARMVELAIADNPLFKLSRIELDRLGPSYTAETLEAFRASLAPGDELYYLVGGDAPADMPYWYHPERVLDLAVLAVVDRPGHDKSAAERLARRLGRDSSRIVWMSGPSCAIAASELRERARLGRSLRYLVPPAVREYIEERRLYAAPRANLGSQDA